MYHLRRFRMGERTLLLWVALVTPVFGQDLRSPTPTTGVSSETHVVVDLAGRRVRIPNVIHNAACHLIPSYERMFVVGAGDKINPIVQLNSPWARTIFPHAPEVHNVQLRNPNVEDLVDRKIDVLFFWNQPDVIAKMARVNIPVIVATSDDTMGQDSFEKFVAFRKREMSMYGEIFGDKARMVADDWNRYFEEKVNLVYSRTKSLPPSERQSVYYVRGPDALTTHGIYSFTWWDLTIGGARPVTTEDTKEVIGHLSAEQLIDWNPDVIFMGWIPSTDLITKDPRWAQLNAVKNNKVFVNPDGFYHWDYGTEAPLLIMYFAKTLHPELFKEIDIASEVKYFYAHFFHYDLNEAQTDRILMHQPPP